jgi:cytochrome c2
MTWDYAKMEKFILEQQGIINGLEQTYQGLKKQ